MQELRIQTDAFTKHSDNAIDVINLKAKLVGELEKKDRMLKRNKAVFFDGRTPNELKQIGTVAKQEARFEVENLNLLDEISELKYELAHAKGSLSEYECNLKALETDINTRKVEIKEVN
jgi:hypothetical protein